MFDDDFDPLDTNHYWYIEQFNLWQPNSQSPFTNAVTHLILENDVVELPKLERLLISLPNLQYIELNGLMDENGDEIPVIDILNLIHSHMPPHLRRFKCNNTVYIPDNTPNINFNSEQSQYSSLRPFSKIKKDIDSINARNKHINERNKLHTLNTLNVVFDKKAREQPGSIILPPEQLHLITTFGHKDNQPTSTVTKRGENYNRILKNIENRGGRRRTRKSRKSRRKRFTKKRKYKH
jgi:hypothetical protein